MKDEGGYVVPESLAPAILNIRFEQGNPFPRMTVRPLTRRERLRLRLSDIRWAIHERLFPECKDEYR